MDKVGSFFKTRRTRCDASPRSLSTPLPERRVPLAAVDV